MKNINLNYKVTHADGNEGIDTWCRYDKVQLRVPVGIRALLDNLLSDDSVDVETISLDLTVNLTRYRISFHSL